MLVSTAVKDQFGIIRFEVDKILGIEAGEFQESLVNLLEKNIKIIIIDLSGVKFVSSWGIGMLMHGLATTKNRGGEFMVAGISEKVAKTFKNLKIFSILDIYPSIEAAMV
jgi:anti-sigma B factor antagonist